MTANELGAIDANRPVTAICAGCGIEFTLSREQRRPHRRPKIGRCCSMRCVGLVAARSRGPAPAPPPLLLTCANCGKRFYATLAQQTTLRYVKLKYGSCCSLRCVGLIVRKHRPSANRLSAHAYARKVFHKALQAGKIVRPEACSRCGDKPGRSRYGRSRIHAHHHDYSKPLDVEWLCARCHDIVHPRSVSHLKHLKPKTKLNEAQVREIKQMLQAGMILRVIAQKFGVSISTIHRIKQDNT
jgi:hypothetical protein